ncbi:MAG: hypothetical protein II956_10695 [Bacteroidales bacterium]|nr:hypothetical protein [Bacteroidales bacterium]
MRKILMTMLMALIVLVSYSQNSRQYIKNVIISKDECKNVAITKTNGDLMLYGRNGYAAQGCPRGLTDALDELNDDNELIDDVVLTENGKWLILYGNNGIQWNNIPYSLESKLRYYNRENEIITSVTFNDYGDWIVITTDYFSASQDWITNWLKEDNNKHGQLWAACITDDAMVAVYETGYRFYGNVPESLKTKLRNSDIDVYRLKIAGTSWFFADKRGYYHYNM